MNQLGLVKNIVEEAGMGISYAYEDLAFLEHNSFLLQFTGKNLEVLVHVNTEADLAAVGHDIGRLQEIGLGHTMNSVKGDEYTLSQADDGSVTIEFIES